MEAPIATEPEVPQMERILFVIKCESLKYDYDPETDTNWCHLPMEMREECIKWMDFQTRFRLKNTAKLEKSLVEKEKVYFDRVEMFDLDKNVNFWLKYDNSKRKNPDISIIIDSQQETEETDEKEKLQFERNRKKVAQLLKASTVGLMWTGFRLKVWPEYREYAPYNIQQIQSYLMPRYLGVFFLQNSEKRVEKLIPLGDLDNFRELVKAPVPKQFRTEIHELEEEDFLPYIQKWFDEDVEIGTKLTCVVQIVATTEMIMPYLSDRLISSTENHYRYRTDNPEKELHLKFGEEKNTYFKMCRTVEFEMMAAEPK